MIPEKVQVKVKEISRVNLSFQTRQSLVNEIRKREGLREGRLEGDPVTLPTTLPTPLPTPTPPAQAVSRAGELQKGRGNFKEPCL